MDEPFIVNLARDQAQDLPKASTYADLIKGGIFIVTGSNTGLGFEAASALVATGAAKVILAVRSQQRGDAAVKNIEEITGFTGVAEVWLLNMASYDSIVAFGERVKTLDKINGISLNAGVVQDQWTVADRGNEMTNMVNVLGTVLLAGLILPTLRQMAAKLGRKTHLSLVGSGTAFQKESDIELEKAVASGRDVIDYFNDEKNMSISRLVIISSLRAAN
jgi:NAD(P)-dependent dehydrogenase (short-subunit alcohol dehydrogenase family)